MFSMVKYIVSVPSASGSRGVLFRRTSPRCTRLHPDDSPHPSPRSTLSWQDDSPALAAASSTSSLLLPLIPLTTRGTSPLPPSVTMPQGAKQKLGGITKALTKSRPGSAGGSGSRKKNTPAPRSKKGGGGSGHGAPGGGGGAAAAASRRLTTKIHNRIESEMAGRLARNSGTLSTLARSVGGGAAAPGAPRPPSAADTAAAAAATAAAAGGGGKAKKRPAPKGPKLKFNAKKLKGKK